VRRRLVAGHVVCVGLALAALAGCSAEPDLGPVFNDEAGAPAGCLAHQEGEPGARYVDVEQRNTGEVLALMKYYTQFGTMPYCDGQPATDSDRAWAQTYLDLGGAADKIPTALG
jgi:hypothetical protein